MRAFLILLLASISTWCMGQMFLPHRHAVIVSNLHPCIPTNTAYAWWVYSDLPTNGTVVTSWLDRIRSYAFVKDATQLAPSNYVDGVRFGKFTCLTNVALPFQNTDSWTIFFIIEPTGLGDNNYSQQLWCRNPPGEIPELQMIKTPIGSNVGTNFCFSYDSTPLPVPLTGYFNPLRLFDFAWFNNFATSNSTMHLSFLTNNIVSYTNSIASGNPFNYYHLGGYNFSGSGLGVEFKLREILIWTNVLQPCELSDLHYYATNKYGFGP